MEAPCRECMEQPAKDMAPMSMRKTMREGSRLLTFDALDPVHERHPLG